MLHKHRMEKTPSKTGLTHEITTVRGQGCQGTYAEDRSIRVLGVEIPSVSLLPRRDEYTRVYTTVYPRVHNLALSISSVGLTCMSVSWG